MLLPALGLGQAEQRLTRFCCLGRSDQASLVRVTLTDTLTCLADEMTRQRANLTVVCGCAVLHRAFQFGYVNAIIQAVKRSRGAGWDDIRTTMDPLKPEVPKL